MLMRPATALCKSSSMGKGMVALASKSSQRSRTPKRRIDNTGPWRTFWKITFPLLRPAHFFVLVVFGIGALKLFDQAFIVGGGSGGPNNATQTPVLYIYRDAFSNFDFGKAAAAGVVLFVIIFTLTLVQRLTVGRQEAA